MINELRLQYPAALLCRILDVSASGDHAWSSRPPSRRAQKDARLGVEIKAAHRRTRETYEAERLQKDLAAYGVKMLGFIGSNACAGSLAFVVGR
jgi:putative transposase